MTRIVVLGSGFAGTYATRRLDRLFRNDKDVEITLISRNNYMVFTPLLPEVAGNTIEPQHAVPPLRVFLKKARFKEGAVREIDIGNKRVLVDYPDGRTAEELYDYLVIALGSVTNFRKTPGALEQSFDLKTLDDAIRLRNHVLAMLEQADITPDREACREMLTFVAGGGGYAGLEGLGQLIDFVDKALRFYPGIERDDVKFILASRGKKLLDTVDEKLGDYVVRKLRERGVDVRLGVTVKAVTERTVTLDPGGDVPTRTVLWAAGIEVNPVVRRLNLKKSSFHALEVHRNLQVIGHPELFALGDCAAVPADTDYYAATAQNATREGILVANNIYAAIKGQPMKEFRFKPVGSLASLGHYQAVAQIFGIPFSGLPAWLAWRVVYLGKMPTMSRRIKVAIDWFLDLILPTDTVQLPVLPQDDVPDEEPNPTAHPNDDFKSSTEKSTGQPAEAH